MDLDRGLPDGTDGRPPRGTDDPVLMSPTDPVIDPADSTALLRRCTALATRARVDLLTAGRHSASEELDEVLIVLESWEETRVADPDPTMVVLAAAALQDLLERLPESSRSTLGARAEAALRVLHTLMRSARIDAMA
ncbi:hypothetical protein [Brachybacterium sacelli]|uniref:DNA-binding transcriptional regulator YbjK n=1 Tax=Brachybacterium sacelli TaxID=173364 RepID=A0ABS4X765_9MICO|nr:hypothetical protein [Brachybacterium sacelli]MBP2384283.1 DNA-binding transcriptional regulator YbjK [Brachybacterium sacelli]